MSAIDLLVGIGTCAMYGWIALVHPCPQPLRTLWTAAAAVCAATSAAVVVIAVATGDITPYAVLSAAETGWLGWCAWRIWTKGKPPRKRTVRVTSKVEVRGGRLVLVPAGGAR